MRQKLSETLWRTFLIVFSIILFSILILCIKKTTYDIQMNEIVFKPFIFALFVVFLGIVCIIYEKFFHKFNKFLLPVFLLVYGVGLFLVSISSQTSPVHDSASVYQGALYMAGLAEECPWHYFARYSNNTMPMIFMSINLRIADLLGFQNVYYFQVIVNVIQVLIALYCIYRITGKIFERNSIAASWCGTILLAIYFPIIGHTQSVYTDAFSFCFSILAFYIWAVNREKNTGKKKYWFSVVIAALIWTIGMQIKTTVIIGLIALTIYIVMFENKKRLVDLVIIWSTIIITSITCSVYKKTLPSMEHYHTWGFPTTSYFIALGLEGDGSFNLDSEYFNTVMGIYGMEEKKQYTHDYIMDNISNFWNKEHMLAKLRKNFADGRMTASDFYQISNNQNFIYQCISYSGSRFRAYTVNITGYWYTILGLCVLTCLLCGIGRKKDVTPYTFIPILSFFGIICFVMLSEANNRQLYNHLPWIFIVANMSIWTIYNSISELIISKRKGIDSKENTV